MIILRERAKSLRSEQLILKFYLAKPKDFFTSIIIVYR